MTSKQTYEVEAIGKMPCCPPEQCEVLPNDSNKGEMGHLAGSGVWAMSLHTLCVSCAAAAFVPMQAAHAYI